MITGQTVFDDPDERDKLIELIKASAPSVVSKVNPCALCSCMCWSGILLNTMLVYSTNGAKLIGKLVRV